MPSPQFTPGEVLEIRYQQAQGTLDCRAWADIKLCSVETVRRVARGDTYRHAAGVKAHPSYGGLQGYASHASPGSGKTHALAASFVPRETPPLASLPGLPGDEPDEAEAAASLARLQTSLAMPVPGDAQASAAVSLLDELQGKGEAARPAAASAKPDAELG